jgi:hypothetical protein
VSEQLAMMHGHEGPNIVWIMTEDCSPHADGYGDQCPVRAQTGLATVAR